MAGKLKISGMQGLAAGEDFYINKGDSVVIGRSRRCDISMRQCLRYLELSPEERSAQHHFHTVSRQHARVSFYSADSVEVVDLSSNGTFVDDRKIDKRILNDLAAHAHVLRLGTQETFKLTIVETDAPAIVPGHSMGHPETDARETQITRVKSGPRPAPEGLTEPVGAAGTPEFDAEAMTESMRSADDDE
jgi:hypothetical protein